MRQLRLRSLASIVLASCLAATSLGFAASAAANISVIETVNIGGAAVVPSIANDASKVFVSNPGAAGISVLNVVNNTHNLISIPVNNPVPSLTTQFNPATVAVRPNSNEAWFGNYFGSDIQLLDTSTNASLPGWITVGSGPPLVPGTQPVLQPFGIAFTPDGSTAYVAVNENTATGDGYVVAIDANTHAVSAPISAGLGPAFLAINSGGTRAYVTNRGKTNINDPSNPFVEVPDNRVSVIDIATNTVIQNITVGSEPSGIAITPDNRWLYVANSASDTVSVISTATNEVVDTIPVGNGPAYVAINPDANRIYVSNKDVSPQGTLSVIDPSSNSVIQTLVVGKQPLGIAVLPNGTKAYLVNQELAAGPSSTLMLLDTYVPWTLTMEITGVPDQVVIGQELTFHVELTRTSRAARASSGIDGEVTIYGNGKALCTAPIVNGSGSCKAVITESGKISFTGVFVGTIDGVPVTMTVNSPTEIRSATVSITKTKVQVKKCRVRLFARGRDSLARQVVRLQVKKRGHWRAVDKTKTSKKKKWKTTIPMHTRRMTIRAKDDTSKSGAITVKLSTAHRTRGC